MILNELSQPTFELGEGHIREACGCGIGGG